MDLLKHEWKGVALLSLCAALTAAFLALLSRPPMNEKVLESVAAEQAPLHPPIVRPADRGIARK